MWKAVSILCNLAVISLSIHAMLCLYNERRIRKAKAPILLPFEQSGYIITNFISKYINKAIGIPLTYDGVILLVTMLNLINIVIVLLYVV